LAPYEVTVLELQQDDDKVVSTAKRIYEELEKAGIETLYDNRDARAGAKLRDADLVGIPFRIAVGKKGLAEGVVELKLRKGTEVRKVKIDEIVPLVAAEITKERTG